MAKHHPRSTAGRHTTCLRRSGGGQQCADTHAWYTKKLFNDLRVNSHRKELAKAAGLHGDTFLQAEESKWVSAIRRVWNVTQPAKDTSMMFKTF